jgi:CDP-paratose 2-epimerase
LVLLITGGCGFLGTNLARRAIATGHRVIAFDNLRRVGAMENLRWLRAQGDANFVHGDISNAEEVARAVEEAEPDAVFHVAGQVAMTTSVVNPRRDFEINALGALNLLEAIRRMRPDAPVLYASTNKVYGDLSQYTYHETSTRYKCAEKPNGFDEDTPLQFQSPYGCSKGAADQYFLEYGRTYGLPVVVLRHSSIYGERQFSTVDQGWIGWFCQKALEAKVDPTSVFTISGDGKQVRDALHIDDAVSLYFAALDRMSTVRGSAFNIGGGPSNSLSLLELFALLERQTGAHLQYQRLPWRQSDQRVFVADIRKAHRMLGWRPEISADEGVRRMLQWTAALASVSEPVARRRG